MSDWGPWEKEEGLDSWQHRDSDAPDGAPTRRQDVELSCSFCGSLHPDTFMDWVRRGAEVGPTDKSYKAYIQPPEPDPLAGTGGEYTLESGTPVTWSYVLTAKFYYQHLSPEQRTEFIRLYNEGAMKIGYPGHFYSMPFFCAAGVGDDG